MTPLLPSRWLRPRRLHCAAGDSDLPGPRHPILLVPLAKRHEQGGGKPSSEIPMRTRPFLATANRIIDHAAPSSDTSGAQRGQHQTKNGPCGTA
jgi:hypothetical protein